MATHASKINGSKPSFASIVAMATPAQSVRGPIVREGTPTKNANPSPSLSSKPVFQESTSALQLHRELRQSMSRLTVREKSPSLSPPLDQENGNAIRLGLRFDDDQTQVSSSSTKPASLDGKSATSGTTFALDEKESLRPDDSASVKAAEEEESYSGPASGAPSSRVGSEAGSRAFRDQFYEISERMGPSSQRPYPVSRRGIPGIEEEAPQMTLPPLDSTLPTAATLQRPEANTPIGATFGFEYKEPDEKLFEALETPKDRLFLLRLEQEVVAFVKDSTEPMIDLPPCNSFCRLLAHKLADYYALTHFVDNAVSSVRLYRTPYCRIRTPLSAISRVPVATDAAPFQAAVKIMRRTGLGKDSQNGELGTNTAGNSMAPSKANSETEDGSQRGTGVVSPTESVVAKDKAAMTREEREAKYKETRERIFKDFDDGDNVEGVDTNETSNEVSRTSSVNEKKKTKKQRNQDDGFEARSKFNAYYPTHPVTTYDQAAIPVTYYGVYGPQNHVAMNQSGQLGSAMLQQVYSHTYQGMANSPGFPIPIQQIPLLNGPSYNAQAPGSSAFPGYNQPPQFYPPVQQQLPLPMVQHSPSMSSPSLNNNVPLPRPQSQLPDQQWQSTTLPYGYQRPREQQQYFSPPMHDQASVPPMHTITYPFGQLPYQPNLQGGRAQHPLPGSYNRQPFNPQTRAFVPGSGNMLQVMSYGVKSNDSVARGPGSVYSNGNQGAAFAQYPESFSQMPPAPLPGSFGHVQDPKTYGTRKSSSHVSVANGPQPSIPNSLSKWGTPAHLPPKPPPPETPNLPEVQHSHSLPASVHASMNIQPLSNGQPMPSFQNGVYSMPSVGNN